MNTDRTEKVRRELFLAEEGVKQLESARTSSAFEEGWVQFLQHLERSYYKLLATYKNNPRWEGWAGPNFKQQRKTDPLLKYLSAARGAEEHGIDSIIQAEPTGVTIVRNLDPSQPVIIRELSFTGGEIQIEGNGNYLLKPHFSVRLAPIVFRGTTTAVPQSHLGQSLAGVALNDTARMAIKWHQSFLQAAETWSVT